MKYLPTACMAALCTVLVFSLVFYSACKPSCKHVACFNGGTCSGGECKCPTGFEGNNCERIKCKDTDCRWAGTCVDGKCACTPGHEGQYCEIFTKDKFIGVWGGPEECDPQAKKTYGLHIGSGATILKLRIGGIRNLFDSVDADIVSTTEIKIPEQTLRYYDDTITLSGTMVRDENAQLHFNYSYRSKDGVLQCSGAYHR
ncbi:hypothetical protein [Polluticoccus soli]|uniref:hypothetical protein n=1 Tax=Polluticoccus soli TaxID=3034150 RepID=UPI0023E181A3|nr:hypothetical protein [Flavipsychrobacter sp. JY13-12]